MFSKKQGVHLYEQRSETRYKLASLVTWSCGEISSTGQVLDISKSGMKIKTRDPVPLLGELNLSSLAAMPLHMVGTVKWVSKIGKNYKFGIQFKELNASQLQYLEDNCLSKLKAC